MTKQVQECRAQLGEKCTQHEFRTLTAAPDYHQSVLAQELQGEDDAVPLSVLKEV